MPENIAQEPTIASDITKHPSFKQAIVDTSFRYRDTRESFAHTYMDALSDQMPRIRSELERKFPDYPPDRLDSVLGLVFGYTALDKTALDPRENPKKPQKYMSARISHDFVHQLLHASSGAATPEYVDTVYNLARNTERQADKIAKLQSTTIPQRLAGMKYELAVARTLLNNGYSVHVPDYMQDPVDTDDEDNEVLQLDVENGIDLLACRGNRVVLIDVKGSRDIHEVTIGEAVERVKLVPGKTQPAVEKAIRAVHQNPEQIDKVTLRIPTEGRSFNDVDLASHKYEDHRNQVMALRQFGNLHHGVQTAIMMHLDDVRTWSDSSVHHTVLGG